MREFLVLEVMNYYPKLFLIIPDTICGYNLLRLRLRVRLYQGGVSQRIKYGLRYLYAQD
jgi:hypothetical protein